MLVTLLARIRPASFFFARSSVAPAALSWTTEGDAAETSPPHWRYFSPVTGSHSKPQEE